jgi:hypothetical protein
VFWAIFSWGKRKTATIPASKNNTINACGLVKIAGIESPFLLPAGWNGSFIPRSSEFSRGAVFDGSFANTGAESIFSVRQTLAAKARIKTASCSNSSLSPSNASSFFTGIFIETANAAMCKPAASLALRKITPAVNPATPLTSAISTGDPDKFSSLIERTSF